MNIFDDIKEKIAKATASLANQKKQLAEFEELEKALGRANQVLEQVASEISQLAVSAQSSQELHGETIKALEKATTAMMELKPDSIEATIKATNQSITEAIQVQARKFTEQLEDTNQLIRTGNEAIHEKLQLQTKALMPFKWISSLTLLAVLALTVLVVMIFTKT